MVLQLVAIGVNAEGFREILGICEGVKEDKSGWSVVPREPIPEPVGPCRTSPKSA